MVVEFTRLDIVTPHSRISRVDLSNLAPFACSNPRPVIGRQDMAATGKPISKKNFAESASLLTKVEKLTQGAK